ncbi:UPF0014 family [Piptocephalis cylindrospora]|uniref:UPF0014 family n=1 Tax=Piptocephalis cylindrospora TaxID=1907219 RepID=A0A4P9Y0E6_9FUNG|nr:UPF0014 family [Piptocephalis cylindrospora]|eukprot:RKP12198.1 UPF0014 family [Piptocephalis cylindrospora]
MSLLTSDPEFPDEPHLSWWNVAVASSFLLINGAISIHMGLGLERTILVAAIRCIIQLTIMGYVLTEIFSSKQPLIIMGLASLLVLLATLELVFHRAKYRFHGSFLTVFGSLYLSTLLVAIVGGSLALETKPFYDPVVFIPTLGMLIGNCMSAVGVGISYALNQLMEHSELVEQRLAFGATRWEASRPVAIDAIKLALLPTINSMSVIGLITIPGMMTGQILGGTPIMDAVKYQQIIMFLITAASSLGTVISVLVWRKRGESGILNSLITYMIYPSFT